MHHQIQDFALTVIARDAGEVYAAARFMLQHVAPETPCRWREFLAYCFGASPAEAMARIDTALQEQYRRPIGAPENQEKE